MQLLHIRFLNSHETLCHQFFATVLHILVDLRKSFKSSVKSPAKSRLVPKLMDFRNRETLNNQKLFLTARAREFKFALELRQGDKLCSAFRLFFALLIVVEMK
jgi:hypothetical protein